MISSIQEEMLQWAVDVRVLLDACRQLIQYYGTDEEANLFQEGLEAPFWFIDALKRIASGTEVATTRAPPSHEFACSEALATIITPLLRMAVEWEPEFLANARESLDETAQKQIVTAYGQFLVSTGEYLCNPLWKRYPHLAPEGWPT